MALLFERAEYEARVAKTKARMEERGLDALVVASPANQFWLTGYDGWSFYTPQVVVATLEFLETVLEPGMSFHCIPALWFEK